MVIAANRPVPLRIQAAESLIKHLQLHGKGLGDAQIKFLLEASATETNADLRQRLLVLRGILNPDSKTTGILIQGYEPALAPPPREEPKKDAEPKKDPEEKKE